MARNNLRQVLENERITQAALARESGLSTNTINKMFNRRANGAATTQGKVVDGINSLSGQNYEVTDIFPDYKTS